MFKFNFFIIYFSSRGERCTTDDALEKHTANELLNLQGMKIWCEDRTHRVNEDLPMRYVWRNSKMDDNVRMFFVILISTADSGQFRPERDEECSG